MAVRPNEGVAQDAEVEYTIRGPSKGCLLLIFREAEPDQYAEFLSAVPPDTNWKGTLTLRRVKGQWKVVEDTNQLMGDAYLLNALSFSATMGGGSLQRENVFASVAAGEALKNELSATEFMDEYYPLMKKCHAEVFQRSRK
ncbi:MAG TPA: hypothetical protein VF121_14780 [Thermoanaerobaculia bacterium]|nr:hypothetical protein [Thermoanaerobaculia bacterium]